MVASVGYSAIRAAAGTVYYLAGVLVKPATKELAQRLIDKGFRIATKGMKDSKIPIHKITDSNIVTYITRAIQAAKKLRAPPKLDPKTGRPIKDSTSSSSGPAPRGANQKSVPQSKIRSKGLEKLKNYGPVGSLPKRVPKKPLDGPKAPPKPVTTSKSTIPKRLAQGLNIAAVAGIGKVAYDAYKEKEAAEKKLKEAERARSDLSTAKDKRSLARKVRAATKVDEAKKKLALAKKKLEAQITKKENRPPPKSKPAPEIEKGAKPLDESSYKKGIEVALYRANKPELKRSRDEAEKEALIFVLNKKIKDKKSTVSKEKAKARAGNYKTLAEAKKAGSLYYLHKDKGLRAAISYQDVKFKMKEIQDKKRKDLGISRDDYVNAFGKLTFKRK